ncbi:MAG: 4Fe-4S binding protein [Clostridiales bacterium]|nr:4Fe-4S binding protein [Clostridiales bacterium]
MNELQLGFIFHKEKCIQCHGCETACKMWRKSEYCVSLRRVFNIWSGTYPDITCVSLSISCMHCFQPACADACPVGAISKREADGVVLVDKTLCTGCRACLDACPYDVPQFGADNQMLKCDMCIANCETPDNDFRAPPCVRTCPTGALGLTAETPGEKVQTENETAALYQRIKSTGNG